MQSSRQGGFRVKEGGVLPESEANLQTRYG
jgi:hypothetical protein